MALPKMKRKYYVCGQIDAIAIIFLLPLFVLISIIAPFVGIVDYFIFTKEKLVEKQR